MKSNHFHKVLAPSIMLFAVHFLVTWLTSPYFEVGPTIVSGTILEVMAYLTCLFLVLKKGKPANHIWYNYILWAILLHIGIIYEAIQM